MNRNTEYELKAQARRLKAALAEMQVPVTHAAALNLIARAQGARRWEELQGHPEAPGGEQKAHETREQEGIHDWLLLLEASLRLQGYGEETLDDAVHDTLAPTEASSVNNQGLFSQLDALYHAYADGPGVLQDGKDPKFEFLRYLAGILGTLDAQGDPVEQPWRLMLPCVVDGQARFGIPVRVSICAGSPFEESITVDALEWFVSHSAQEIHELVKSGLNNTDLSDEVGLWLERHSTHASTRSALGDLMASCRLLQERRPGLVGITVDIDEDAVSKYRKLVLQEKDA